MQQPPNEGGPQPPQPPYYPPQYQQQPYQQQPWQQPPPPKKKRRTWLWIVLGVLAIVVLGCIGVVALASQASKSVTTGTISTTISSKSTPSSSGTIAKVGQTITVDGVETTLVSVKPLAADDITRPKPGNQFILVHIKMHNTNDSERDYNPFDFHVKSGAGNITTEEIVPPSSYTGNNQINSGKLSASGAVEGDLIFQVPKGDHKAELTWQPSFFGNAGDNGWNLGL